MEKKLYAFQWEWICITLKSQYHCRRQCMNLVGGDIFFKIKSIADNPDMYYSSQKKIETVVNEVLKTIEIKIIMLGLQTNFLDTIFMVTNNR